MGGSSSMLNLLREALRMAIRMKLRHGLLTLLIVHSFAHAQAPPRDPPTPSRGFSVSLSFSENAKKKLIESKETIIVIAYFTGTPKSGVPFSQYKQYTSRPGPMGVGEQEVEVLPGEAARFLDFKLKQGALPLLDSDGPQLLINVVSGRRSSKDNLLLCGIYEGSLKAAEGTDIPIYCKLIRGDEN
jgi:hypothetical protein